MKEVEELDSFTGFDDQYISRWTARITVHKPNLTAPILGKPVFFVAKEGRQPNENGFLKVFPNADNSFFKVQHGLNNNTYEQIELGSNQSIGKSSLIGIEVDESLSWQLDKIWMTNYQTLNVAQGGVLTTKPNVVMVRPTETQDGFTFVIRYSKRQFNNSDEADKYSEIMSQDFSKVVASIDTNIQQAELSFNTKFQTVFGDGYKDFLDTMPDAQQFARETLANLFGGMGYFYGPIRIKDETDPTGHTWFYDEPAGLFTCTPSRPYFPRGFLWDEGFHSQLTC